MDKIQRVYQTVIHHHLENYGDKIILLAGPRQVGKTTLGHMCLESDKYRKKYLSWDEKKDQEKIMNGLSTIDDTISYDISDQDKYTVYYFDEIHKYPKWKDLLRSWHAKLKSNDRIIVTGSARMEEYKKGGESLKGLSFLYHVFPLTVAEIIRSDPDLRDINPPKEIDNEKWNALLQFGGFPDPYLKSDILFYNCWSKDKDHLLIYDDIRDHEKSVTIKKIEKLANSIRDRVKNTTNYTTLASYLNVKEMEIKNWISKLESHYYCFSIQRWSKKSDAKSTKNPKIYLWDWSELTDKGARYENIVAVHLKKAIYFWNDNGGNYDLYYLEDERNNKNVDFLILKNSHPWLMLEIKSSNKKGVSEDLKHFKDYMKTVPHVLQVVGDMTYQDLNCFELKKIISVPMKTFLSQLV